MKPAKCAGKPLRASWCRKSAAELSDPGQVPPPATLAYEYWDGSSWEPLTRDDDETWALLRTGRIVVSAPAGRPKKAQIGRVAQSLFWLRVRLVDQAFDRVPRLEQVLTNTTEARQAVTVRDEVLGRGRRRTSC